MGVNGCILVAKACIKSVDFFFFDFFLRYCILVAIACVISSEYLIFFFNKLKGTVFFFFFFF